jgi:hypothetical protein
MEELRADIKKRFEQVGVAEQRPRITTEEKNFVSGGVAEDALKRIEGMTALRRPWRVRRSGFWYIR